MNLAETKVFVVSAPSGAGKTTLVQAMLARFDCFAFSISVTTRPPRAHEQEGVHYYFRTEAEFRALVAAGAFLEWEEVYPGRLYGTLRAEVDRILATGRYPLFDVDVKGGLNIKGQYGPRALALFIQPPSLEQLRDRLEKRGTDSPEEINRRIAKAAYEMSFADQFEHVIINDRLEEATVCMADLFAAHLNATFV